MKKKWFNWFDVAVVCAVLLLGAAAWLLFLRAPVAEETPFADGVATYVVEVTNLTPEQIETIEVGHWIRDGVRLTPIGHVVGIEQIPFTMRVEDYERQEVRFDPVAGRYTALLTIETPVVVTDRAILANGQFTLKGGATLHFIGPGFGFSNAVILTIHRGGA